PEGGKFPADEFSYCTPPSRLSTLRQTSFPTFSMKSLRDVVQEYKQAHKAIGHFNISDSNQLHAIAQASKETGLPAIIGLSEGEREYFPIRHARALVTFYQA